MQLHKQALVIKVAKHGPDSISAALTMNALGECFLALEDADKAEENLTRALAIGEGNVNGSTKVLCHHRRI